MYKIEKHNYGLKLTFEGFIVLEEIKQWQKEVLATFERINKKIGLLIDMRNLKPLSQECHHIIVDTQKKTMDKIVRSATITNQPITDMQMKRLGKISGVNGTKMYVDASASNYWEEIGLLWVIKGQQVDLNAQNINSKEYQLNI